MQWFSLLPVLNCWFGTDDSDEDTVIIKSALPKRKFEISPPKVVEKFSLGLTMYDSEMFKFFARAILGLCSILFAFKLIFCFFVYKRICKATSKKINGCIGVKSSEPLSSVSTFLI